MEKLIEKHQQKNKGKGKLNYTLSSYGGEKTFQIYDPYTGVNINSTKKSNRRSTTKRQDPRTQQSTYQNYQNSSYNPYANIPRDVLVSAVDVLEKNKEMQDKIMVEFDNIDIPQLTQGYSGDLLPNFLTLQQAKDRHSQLADYYFDKAPTASNLYNGIVNWLKSHNILEPEGTGMITGTVPTPNKINPKGILKAYESVRRLHPESPVRSAPIMDIFRLQIPSFKTGSLGYGHKYRSIGNNKGLKSVLQNGIVSKNPTYNKADVVYWAEGEPLREYTGNSALMLSYDKNGSATFIPGNFGNPTSSASNPISFYDDAVTLHGRYPFTSWYHEIPKTEEGIRHANMLGYLNSYVEQPVKWGIRGYLGYKGYNWYTNWRFPSKEKNEENIYMHSVE